MGKQLQFDWKEDIRMVSKHGEVFEFNILSSTLGSSRLHVFMYSKFKTRIDVQRSLIKTFEYIGGLPEELLTDNMSNIVNTKTGEFSDEFKAFIKDIGINAKKCKPRHPYTKGKDESANRFMSWLIPYNHEFEDEEELVKIIKEKNINYKEEYYIEGLSGILQNKTQEQIEALAKKNLENLNKLCEVK